VEDSWHSYSGENTTQIISRYLSSKNIESNLLLNAGAGVYSIETSEWQEIVLDLFTNPINKKSSAICANIEQLPFRGKTFGTVICVGEVLAYCDPSKAIMEFARVLVPSGKLICDFSNSTSIRYLFREQFGRAADMITDIYNGTSERTWIYHPNYIKELLILAGFNTIQFEVTHTWSALALRLGVSKTKAVNYQKYLNHIPFPRSFADLITIVAVRDEVELKY
jgi:SAM-dependent methyltransferase